MGSTSRELGAAASALGSYLTTVLPPARRELERWGPLPAEKTKNAEAVALFATLAPRARRATAVRAIIALQVAIDLRDALEETGDSDPEVDARIAELEASRRREVATLPSIDAVLPYLERAVERCEAGQLHTHLAARQGPEPLRQWATGLEAPADYRWWEIAAGAGSSVAAHALIAAAADPRTSPEDAAAIDAAYHPPIGALTVFLDDLVDQESDLTAGEHSYLAYYEDSEQAAQRLALIAARAEAMVERLPRSPRHRAILAGIAGYYLGDPAARLPYAVPIRERLLATLGPAARLLTGFTRVRRLGERKWSGQAGNSPGP